MSEDKKHRRQRRPRRKAGGKAVALPSAVATIETNGNGTPHDALMPRTLEPEIIDRAAAGSIRVLALRNPFTMVERVERYVPEEATLARERQLAQRVDTV